MSREKAVARDKAFREHRDLPCEHCGEKVPYWAFPANPFHPIVCDGCARLANAQLEAARAAR
jgi:hypothetical protein